MAARQAWALLGALALAACAPVGLEAAQPEASRTPLLDDVGPEAGVPTPVPSPALSPLLPYWAAWPEGPGFLEPPLAGAPRAHLAFGVGPDGPVGWMVGPAALLTYDAVYGQGKAPVWPVPPDAPGAQVAPMVPGGQASLSVAQVLAVEVEGDADGLPEAGELFVLAFQLKHESGGGTPWQSLRPSFAHPELVASGQVQVPPLAPGKLRWALPPHPSAEAFRTTLRVGAQAPELPWPGSLLLEAPGQAPQSLPFLFQPRPAATDAP